jgi:hypothetical protein
VRFSFTRLATYRRCPFQYKLRYQHHLPGQPRPGTRLGVALHAALATFYRDRRPVPWPDDLLAVFDAQWPAELTERDVRAMDEGRTLLVDYFRRQGDSWVQPHLSVVHEATAKTGSVVALGGRPRRLGGTQAGKGTWWRSNSCMLQG